MGNVPERKGWCPWLGWRTPGLARRGYRRWQGPGPHGQRAVIVLEAMVLVTTENEAASAGCCADRNSTRKGLWGERWVRRHSSPHHVAEVAIRKACVGKGRRWSAVVCSVLRSFRGSGWGWIVRFWGSGSFSWGCGRGQTWFELGGLSIVQICTGRGFWRFWGSLVGW